MHSTGVDDRLVQFADSMGLFYEDLGLPRAWGRVLGWLLVCEPDYQSADDLVEALHSSKGSISMATRSLIRTGGVERYTKRRDRRTYYRIRPGAWTGVFEQHAETARRLRELSAQGLNLLPGDLLDRRRRLQELHELTSFYERESVALLTHWKNNRPQA